MPPSTSLIYPLIHMIGTNTQNVDYNSPNDASYQQWSFIWVVDLAPISIDWQNIAGMNYSNPLSLSLTPFILQRFLHTSTIGIIW